MEDKVTCNSSNAPIFMFILCKHLASGAGLVVATLNTVSSKKTGTTMVRMALYKKKPWPIEWLPACQPEFDPGTHMVEERTKSLS